MTEHLKPLKKGASSKLVFATLQTHKNQVPNKPL